MSDTPAAQRLVKLANLMDGLRDIYEQAVAEHLGEAPSPNTAMYAALLVDSAITLFFAEYRSTIRGGGRRRGRWRLCRRERPQPLLGRNR